MSRLVINIIRLFMGLISVLVFTSNTSAQNWRAVQPIESTCKDVERLLGGSACDKQNIEYRLPDATVVFVFATSTCDEKWPYEKYNVAPGTVTFIRAFLKPPYNLSISDLGVDKSKLHRDNASDELGILEYENRELGYKVEVSEEELHLRGIDYFPPSKYDHLRCFPPAKSRKATEPNIYVSASHFVGEYYPFLPDKEKQFLGKLVAELKDFDNGAIEGQKPMVYVIAYAGQRAQVDEAQQFVERTKNLLIGNCKIDANRIIGIDGGYRERAVVQLFIRPFGAPAPDIQPTVHPSKVELTGKKKRRSP